MFQIIQFSLVIQTKSLFAAKLAIVVAVVISKTVKKVTSALVGIGANVIAKQKVKVQTKSKSTTSSTPTPTTNQ